MKNVFGPLKKSCFILNILLQGKPADLMPLLFVIWGQQEIAIRKWD